MGALCGRPGDPVEMGLHGVRIGEKHGETDRGADQDFFRLSGGNESLYRHGPRMRLCESMRKRHGLLKEMAGLSPPNRSNDHHD